MNPGFIDWLLAMPFFMFIFWSIVLVFLIYVFIRITAYGATKSFFEAKYSALRKITKKEK